jgi:type IV secretion system T-DNA border endonuclease VirD1
MSYTQKSLLPEEVAISLTHDRGQKVDPNGYRIVSVRLREAEFEAFSTQASALGLTNNMALRIAARRIGGFLELDAETHRVLEDVLGMIGTISRGINRLQATYAESGTADLQAFSELRAAFGYEFARLDAMLMSILNTANRRLDGRLRLKGAAT